MKTEPHSVTSQHYKAAEVRTVDSVQRNAHAVGRALGRLLRALVGIGNRRFTVMLIPHAQRRVFNFRISVFMLAFAGVLLTGLIVAFLTLSTGFTRNNEQFMAASRSLTASETTVEELSDEVKELQRVVTEFRASLESVLNVVGTDDARGYLTGGVGGDLAAFVSESLVIANDVRSLTELRSLRSYLESAIGPLNEIEQALLTQKELLVDIPTLWPVSTGKGYITADFGPATHPFTGSWYIHKGIDIAWLRGTEIVATANGKVQRVGYDPHNLGHFAVIKHKYGFVTWYGHMNQVPVIKPGQPVARGEVIGYMGSSGLSTGPHLHYEVRIAEQVVNPRQFLTIMVSGRGTSR